MKEKNSFLTRISLITRILTDGHRPQREIFFSLARFLPDFYVFEAGYLAQLNTLRCHWREFHGLKVCWAKNPIFSF